MSRHYKTLKTNGNGNGHKVGTDWPSKRYSFHDSVPLNARRGGRKSPPPPPPFSTGAKYKYLTMSSSVHMHLRVDLLHGE
jgi:hypothetical protein